MIDGKCKPIVIIPPRDHQIGILKNIINKQSSTTDPFLPAKKGLWYKYTRPNKVDRMFIQIDDVDKLKDSNIITEQLTKLVMHVYNRCV